jgi:glycosyltransferase involved in cell wall biosynthesis
MSISIAIAAFNEEKNILRCLKSVYDWADELIIVDGSSKDKTVQLIKKFDQKKKIKIFIENNPPMFHINKQKAIERCTKDWILQLDADEVVSEELKKEILSIIKNPETNRNMLGEIYRNSLFESQPVAYWLPRLNFFLGKPLKKGGQYPDYTLRLYRNGVARFPCKSVHEQVMIKHQIQNSKQFRNLKLAIGYLTSPLLHYPYPSFSEYLRKWDVYTSLEAENLKKQGFKPSFWNFIKYFFLLPKLWFFKTYLRHLGFLDGFPGFVFCLFSAIELISKFNPD